MQKESEPAVAIQRIGRTLHRVVPIVDSAGKVVQYAVTPLMVELRFRDVMQIFVGASLLAIPVGFTEEAWMLGERLPLGNILLLSLVSITFIASFVYFNFYRTQFRGFEFEFVKRILAIYLLSLLVVGLLLTIIQVTPWDTDPLLAIKRMVIVAFPASMSAAVSDMLK